MEENVPRSIEVRYQKCADGWEIVDFEVDPVFVGVAVDAGVKKGAVVDHFARQTIAIRSAMVSEGHEAQSEQETLSDESYRYLCNAMKNDVASENSPARGSEQADEDRIAKRTVKLESLLYVLGLHLIKLRGG